jgi:RimJ/RimL family protein N-acetyltransferase
MNWTLSLPGEIKGFGLTLRPWDEDLIRQAAKWGTHGFPYAAFDLAAQLKDRYKAQLYLRRMLETDPHLHFVATVEGRAIGRLSVNVKDASGLYIWSVHVPPEYEGRGVCRRMMACLMTWLEREIPGRQFVLTTNTFATHAHRAYEALGFKRGEERWQFDQEIARELWKAPDRARQALTGHTRFCNGRWEVRAFVMTRQPGTPMAVAERAKVAADR